VFSARLASSLVLSLFVAGASVAATTSSGLSELPRKAGVGLRLQLQGLRAPKAEVHKYRNGTRTFHHSYRALYGGRTLKAGKPTLVLHLVHRIEMIFKPRGGDPIQVAVDNETTSYEFVNPEEISIAGATLQILSFDDSSLEFVEQ
jgi:hypothetical protein